MVEAPSYPTPTSTAPEILPPVVSTTEFIASVTADIGQLTVQAAHEDGTNPATSTEQTTAAAGTPPVPSTQETGGEPPDGGTNAELGENEREVIGITDFREYFKLRVFGTLYGENREINIRGFEQMVERELGEDKGYRARMLIRELRNNYFEHCALDIYVGEDSGHRILVVSQAKKTGIVHLDYYDEDELRPETFNIYAKAFGQPREPTEGQGNERVEPTEDQPVLTEAERLARDEAALLALLTGGDEAATGELGEGGRGIPLMLSLARDHLIERYGPNNRGAHLHLAIPPQWRLGHHVQPGQPQSTSAEST